MPPDVVVVGAGIVGCAIARELAAQGRKVLVVERGEIGTEASRAAAGILTPVHLAEYPPPLAALCEASAALYPGFIESLRGETSIDPDYRACGLLLLARSREDREAIETLAVWKRDHARPAERVAKPGDLEPVLDASLSDGLLLPDVAQVRNHRLTLALAESAGRTGAEFRTGTQVTSFLRVPGRVTGVKTSRGDIRAGETVVAAGAWASELLAAIDVRIRVRPVRGQMVLLQGPPDLVRRILLWGDHYVVPRADGWLLVGSTMEEAGFESRVTAGGVAGILSNALAVAPGLAKLPIDRTWAGLRPMTPDRMPYLGRPAGLSGLTLAAGHGRNGILLAPITALAVADLISARPASFDLTPFSPDRHASP